MFWSVVCTLDKSKVVDRDMLGPFETMDQAIDTVKELRQEIKSNGMRSCSSYFELLSDDVPELVVN